ncbi:NUDIX hydrolase [Nocardia ninae]|uniref:Nudix hydrolase domain-containing protein n=1 Tax=Nocardia ninae NBRC 108245 TaxID=1210091 RepID=A0A511MEK5_9NOCA|nr:NUDIX hydrolase [Nocardia ninae]GEM38538.1 hypothetical protein NN4_30570 [Nocardia ninae NBRC 108245]
MSDQLAVDHYLCRDIHGEAHIVHQDELVRRTSVYALLQDDSGIVLVRGGSRPDELWDLPGGGVEPGEELTEALGREVHEETGLQLVGKPVKVCEFIEYYFDIWSETGWESKRHYFRAAASGTPVWNGNDDDVAGVRCFAPPIPVEVLTPVARKIVAMADETMISSK